MFRVSIKNTENVESNAATFASVEEGAAWIEENHDFFPEDYTTETVDITQALATANEKAGALAYLASTDWYIVRFVETSVVVPAEVLTLRAAARLKA